jgi:hypothetical protein
LFASVGIGVGALFAGVGLRPELSDDDHQASLATAVITAIGCAGPIWLGVEVLLAAVFGWNVAGERGGAVFAVAGSAALVVAMGLAYQAAAGREGIDREVLFRSASFAFVATLLAAVTYALLESLAGAPRLSMWAVWTFGMLTWAAATGVYRRRMV